MLNSPVDVLLPNPLYLLVLLLAMTWLAFRRRHSRLHRWRYLLVLAGAWTWLALTPVFAHWLGGVLESRHAALAIEELPDAPVFLVLASGEAFDDAHPGALQLDLASLRRTLAAVHAWNRKGGLLVFSGTAWPGEPQPVAERMARLALLHGVPARAIRLETSSLNTRENIEHASALPELAHADIVLVTSALHMPRAMAVADDLGLSPVAFPADFRTREDLAWHAWLPNARALPLLALVLHEWIGGGYYVLRGWH